MRGSLIILFLFYHRYSLLTSSTSDLEDIGVMHTFRTHVADFRSILERWAVSLKDQTVQPLLSSAILVLSPIPALPSQVIGNHKTNVTQHLPALEREDDLSSIESDSIKSDSDESLEVLLALDSDSD